MRFTDILAATAACLLWVGIAVSPARSEALTESLEPSVSESVVVTYDPADGKVSVDGNGVDLTTIELVSLSSSFNVDGLPAGLILPPFDVAEPGKIFHLNTGGFSSVELGDILPTGWNATQLIDDIEINGSILPRGGLSAAPGGGPFIYVVPEPSSFALLCVGLMLAIRKRR